MIIGELKNRIDSIWDIFWSAGMSNPLTVIEQITYLMFLKLLDERELQRESKATLRAELADPIFDSAHQDCRWHIIRNYEAEELFHVIGRKAFPFLKEHLYDRGDTAFGTYMKDALFLVPSPRVLLRVVDILDGLDLSNKDIMGDVYEYLLSQIARSGTNGQFRTPRHIIRMIVELMEPSVEDTICDPAMGSAGFITAAAQYIAEHSAAELREPANRQRYATSMFSGFDTDQTMLRIGSMNMLLHGVEAPNITWLDALSDANKHREEYSLILANPPFTGSLDKEAVSKDLLSICPTGKTELLFLALFLRALRVGGRCASIVPDGVLFGSSRAHRAIRQELVENQRLEAVISMPSGVFRPYAGVSTAVLIFTKTNCGGTDKVWFYHMKADGFSLDDKRSPIPRNDIPDILARFKELSLEGSRSRKDQSFLVPKEEIVEHDYDLSINKYRETACDSTGHPPAEQILDQIYAQELRITKGLELLKQMLAEEL